MLSIEFAGLLALAVLTPTLWELSDRYGWIPFVVAALAFVLVSAS